MRGIRMVTNSFALSKVKQHSFLVEKKDTWQKMAMLS